MTAATTIISYLGEGLAAARPATPSLGTGVLGIWFSTDTGVLSAWDGAAWADVNPVATSSVLGLVKPDGTIITISAGAITVAKASSSLFGVVKVDGTTITAAGGVISASASGPTFSDGTNTVSGATSLTITGGLVGGSSPSATFTLPSLNVSAVTVSGATQTLTPGTTIGKYKITLQHNVTITMSGGTDGMVVLLELIQDATGSRTVAFDSSVQFGTDITSFTATTTAGASDFVLLTYSAALSKWCFLSYSRGF